MEAESPILVPNLPTIPSHAPAGWRGLIEEAIAVLDREDPGWRLLQIKQKFGGLRLYYSVAKDVDPQGRRSLDQAIQQIETRSYEVCDVCGLVAAPSEGLRSRTRCADHIRSGDVDAPIEVRPIESLHPDMGGVWLVQTRWSTHLWDLDEMTYTRRPGPSRLSGGTRFDGNPMPITRVEAWPAVGESFVVWFDDPEDPDLTEYSLSSSVVRRIERLDLDNPPRCGQT